MATSFPFLGSQVENIQALPVQGDNIGQPRLEHYAKLLSRFYESLLILETLGQTRGQHTHGSPPLNRADAARRTFTDYLAYLCDYDKGGGTCTAIGIEDSAESYNFWVALPQESAAVASTAFLRRVLNSLQTIEKQQREGVSTTQQVLRFVRLCVTHARPRLTKELACLQRFIQRCQTRITEGNAPPGMCNTLLLGLVNLCSRYVRRSER